jgi:hypothetical protein
MTAALREVPLDTENENEQMVLLDYTYKELGRIDGDASSVSEETAPLRAKVEAQFVTHNHPMPTPLSASDIKNIVALGRDGIEARCRPVTTQQRALLNQYFESARSSLTRMRQYMNKQARAEIDAMIDVIDTFMANPTSTQWSFVAHNSQRYNPQFRTAGLIEGKIKKSHTNMAIHLSSMGGRTNTAEEMLMRRYAFNIIVQQATMNMVLAGYPALTHGIAFE